MNSTLLNLYDYMTLNKEVVENLINMKEDFYFSNDALNMGFGIISNIKDGLSKIDKITLFCNDYLNTKSKQLFFISDYINKDGYLNGYLIYDFLKIEYFSILNDIEKFLGL